MRKPGTGHLTDGATRFSRSVITNLELKDNSLKIAAYTPKGVNFMK
jgi:hypothetical protein